MEKIKKYININSKIIWNLKFKQYICTNNKTKTMKTKVSINYLIKVKSSGEEKIRSVKFGGYIKDIKEIDQLIKETKEKQGYWKIVEIKINFVEEKSES